MYTASVCHVFCIRHWHSCRPVQLQRLRRFERRYLHIDNIVYARQQKTELAITLRAVRLLFTLHPSDYNGLVASK